MCTQDWELEQQWKAFCVSMVRRFYGRNVRTVTPLQWNPELCQGFLIPLDILDVPLPPLDDPDGGDGPGGDGPGAGGPDDPGHRDGSESRGS